MKDFLKQRPDLADKVVQSEEEDQQAFREVPQRLTLWQFKQACSEVVSPLPGFDNLEQLIDFMFSQMPESTEKQRALRAWNQANHIERNSPSIELFRLKVNEVVGAEIMSVKYVDELFIAAELVEA